MSGVNCNGYEPRVEHLVCPCNTISDFRPPCGIHLATPYQWPETVPVGDPFPSECESSSAFRLGHVEPIRLTDAEVDRIARRLAAILKERP